MFIPLYHEPPKAIKLQLEGAWLLEIRVHWVATGVKINKALHGHKHVGLRHHFAI